MNAKDGIVLWLLGAAGTILIYSAIKGHTPAATLKGYFTNTTPANTTSTYTSTHASLNLSYMPKLNSNGVDIRSLPPAYQSAPNNNIPLTMAV